MRRSKLDSRDNLAGPGRRIGVVLIVGIDRIEIDEAEASRQDALRIAGRRRLRVGGARVRQGNQAIEHVEELRANRERLARLLAEGKPLTDAQRLAGPALSAEVAVIGLLRAERAERGVHPGSGVQNGLHFGLQAAAVRVLRIEGSAGNAELAAALP